MSPPGHYGHCRHSGSEGRCSRSRCSLAVASTGRRPSPIALAPQSTYPVRQSRKPAVRIVVHHDHEEQGDREETEAEDVFAGAEAEGLPLRRLEDVDQDLTAI